MTAAQHAMAEGDYALAAQRLIYARDAEPRNAAVLRLHDARLLAGRRPAAPRAAPCATGRASRASGPRRTASPRASTRTWARSTSPPRRPTRAAAPRARRTPTRGSASGACACGSWTARRAIDALERARRLGPSVEGLLDLALAHHLAGDLGAEVTATEQATLLDPDVGAGVGALRARARAHRPRQRRDRRLRARARAQPRRRRGRRPPRAPARGPPARPARRVSRRTAAPSSSAASSLGPI